MKYRIIVFGTGIFYKRRKHLLPPNVEIVAFLDNDSSVQGTEFEGKVIYSPESVCNLTYDKIVLASLSWPEMKKQLLDDKGLKENDVVFWDEFIAQASHGVLKKYEIKGNIESKKKKRILIITYIVNYAGGFLAAFNMALVLKKIGYEVSIVSAQVLGEAVNEVNESGISVWECPSLPYVESTELKWIREFDFVIVNSLQMLIAAQRISKYVPTMLWLHEYSGQYKLVLEQYSKFIDFENKGMFDIYAVSTIAKNNFKMYFQEQKVGILPFGIMSENGIETINLPEHKEKIVFAIIGNISELKNQKEFIYAMEQCTAAAISEVECWIIGRDGGKKYKKELEEMIENKTHFKMCGEYSREQIQEAYRFIDVVVCTSQEETMSMSIVEGLMNGKICITNMNTGIAEYIQNGVNGYVYQNGNVKELAQRIDYVIENFDKHTEIRQSARDTYEKEFSINVFSNRLLKILESNHIFSS